MFGSPPIPILKCIRIEKWSEHLSGVEPKAGKENTVLPS